MSRSTNVFVLLISIAVAGSAQEAFGTWKVNPARSSFGANPHATEITLRIERHARGEVATLDRILPNGLAVTTSIILSMDGQVREFRGEFCTGTQSSQRLDDRTVEVRFQCQEGRSVRVRRRTSPESRDLILEISDQLPRTHEIQWRLVLNKQ